MFMTLRPRPYRIAMLAAASSATRSEYSTSEAPSSATANDRTAVTSLAMVASPVLEGLGTRRWEDSVDDGDVDVALTRRPARPCPGFDRCRCRAAGRPDPTRLTTRT